MSALRLQGWLRWGLRWGDSLGGFGPGAEASRRAEGLVMFGRIEKNSCTAAPRRRSLLAPTSFISASTSPPPLPHIHSLSSSSS